MHALVFPGQGTQRRGMGEQLFARSPDLTEQAEEILGWPLREICAQGDPQQLTDTRYAQPAVFMVGALGALAREEERPGAYQVYAGHSLGEYNALVAAGVLDLMTALRLVRDRAEAMAEVTGGGMAAVAGVPAPRVQQLLLSSGLGQVHLANLNSDRQVTIAGEKGQLELFIRVLKSTGQAKVVPLRVSGPFHTPLMAPGLPRLRERLEQTRFAPGHAPVVSSVTGEIFDTSRAAEILVRQLVAPVEWVRVVHRLRALGVDVIEELEGTTLTSLCRAVR